MIMFCYILGYNCVLHCFFGMIDIVVPFFKLRVIFLESFRNNFFRIFQKQLCHIF